MPEQSYAFIDGAHFRRYFVETLHRWTGEVCDLDMNKVRNICSAQKCFYYDCLDDIRGENESLADFNFRVEKQEQFFDRLQRSHATHVRLGSLTGTAKNKRQKQVDILLAVEMMNHGARRNLSRAVLVSGDQDFKPLIESMVDMGIFAFVYGDVRHTSKDLAAAADSYRPLRLTEYAGMARQDIANLWPLPTMHDIGEISQYIGNPVECTGTYNGNEIKLLKVNGEYRVQFPFDESFVLAKFTDIERLRLFCEIQFPGCKWN